MKSLFDLQVSTGQAWPDVLEHLTAKDAEIAAIAAERDAAKQTLADARAAWEAQDFTKIQALAVEADKTAKQKRIEEAQAKRDAAQAELDAAKA